MIGAGRRQFAVGRRGGSPIARRATAARRSRRRRLPRPGPRVLVAMLAVVALAAGGWVWLRNSSLVAVRQVTITGVSGPDAGAIRSALRAAAHAMTTLNVRTGALRTAVAPFPVVKHVTVTTSFPHGMRIDVSEQVPVAMVSADGTEMAVSADGTLLRDSSVTGALPTIAVGVAPGGTHVSGAAMAEVRLVAAAPYRLLAKVSQVSSDSTHGLTAQLRNGPKLYFGDAGQLGAKWASAAAVLASASSAGADYIDVSVASRPAAGTGADTAQSPAASTGAGTTGGAATSAGATAGSAATAGAQAGTAGAPIGG
jgi:cell division protein FtsQ